MAPKSLTLFFKPYVHGTSRPSKDPVIAVLRKDGTYVYIYGWFKPFRNTYHFLHMPCHNKVWTIKKGIGDIISYAYVQNPEEIF